MALPYLLKDNLNDLSMPIGGATVESDFITNFTMQVQGATNWCWAAVSSSTSSFFDSSSSWTQCKIVDKRFGRSDCCSDENSSNCNKADQLELGLQITENYSRDESGNLILPDLRNEIKNKRPVHIFLSSINGKIGHFVAITGYSTNSAGETRYQVQDPTNGTSHVLYEDLNNGNYNGHGGMTWKYFTKP